MLHQATAVMQGWILSQLTVTDFKNYKELESLASNPSPNSTTLPSHQQCQRCFLATHAPSSSTAVGGLVLTPQGFSTAATSPLTGPGVYFSALWARKRIRTAGFMMASGGSNMANILIRV